MPDYFIVNMDRRATAALNTLMRAIDRTGGVKEGIVHPASWWGRHRRKNRRYARMLKMHGFDETD